MRFLCGSPLLPSVPPYIWPSACSSKPPPGTILLSAATYALVHAEVRATPGGTLALAEELGMRPLVAHCHLGLGVLHQRMGNREPARVALSMAIELLRAMEMTFWLPRAEAALAKVA